MSWELMIAILALVCAGIALFFSLNLSLRLKRINNKLRKGIRNIAPAALKHAHDEREKPKGPIYVIYNPTKKTNWELLRQYLREAAVSASLPEPVWLATTEDDPGIGQTRQALAAGASVVIAAGGDGTVRTVGVELAGTNTPLGLLPVGTGNLLARNLNLPLESTKEMASIALTGMVKNIDVAWLEISDSAQDAELVHHAKEQKADLAQPGKYGFLVIGGMGFDADVMNSTSSKLKNTVGWLAYVSAGLKNLFANKMQVEIFLGDSGERISTEARSVMFMNCGELTGGIVLEPNADPADSWLDLAILNIKGGVFGWIEFVRKVMAKNINANERELGKINSAVGGLDIRKVRTCIVKTDSLQAVQIDGDGLGYANALTISIEPSVLQVRVRQ